MPLLVYFAPVRVAPRRLLVMAAPTPAAAPWNALHAAADIIRVGLFTSTLYQPPSEPSLPPPPELEVAPQDASHGRSLVLRQGPMELAGAAAGAAGRRQPRPLLRRQPWVVKPRA